MDYYKWHKRLLEEGKSWKEISKMTWEYDQNQIRLNKIKKLKIKIKNKW